MATVLYVIVLLIILAGSLALGWLIGTPPKPRRRR